MSRVIDVVVGGIGLIWLMPLLIFAVLLVMLDGGGPVIERRPWCRPDGREVALLRLRTTRRAGAAESGAQPARSRIGHLLWVSRIDDLPLLINLVRGEVSLFAAPAAPLRTMDGPGGTAGTSAA